MKKLISMTDYVKLIDSQAGNGGHYDKIIRYANFLRRPLKLEMLVPCDENGNVLFDIDYCFKNKVDYCRDEYQKALSKVLFKGLEFQAKNSELWRLKINGKSEAVLKNKTIEDLIKYNLELTDNKM